MQFIYPLSQHIYQFLILVLTPFSEKAKLLKNGRKESFEILNTFRKNNPKANTIWFHAASLGEFEQARPVLEKFKTDFPNYKVVLTFFSPSGYEVRKNYELADCICYLPKDSKNNAQQFLDLVQPKIALFAKYEFWHYYISLCKERNIPFISFSTIFREGQIYFKKENSFHHKILQNISYFFVQNEQSGLLLAKSGINNFEITGDTRFDRVYEICQNRKSFTIIEQFVEDKPTLIIGSAWQEDINVLAPVLNQFSESLKVIIASHEIDKNTIDKMKSVLSKASVNYSEANEKTIQGKDILFIDNIGILSSLYQYAQFVHIGGAFGKGLHNTLEAATYGVPIFFGPNYNKFQEAIDLIEVGGAFSISDSEEFKQKFTELYHNKNLHQSTCEKTREYVGQNLGASQKIIDFCKEEYL
ncbi:MAG: 3-deoxy-D-manno-octulosonic acid transferase [Cytophagales bacterium]|nr:3-deoxy-D-manno-octulosonic acid transferase [Cytophagales bacterium]